MAVENLLYISYSTTSYLVAFDPSFHNTRSPRRGLQATDLRPDGMQMGVSRSIQKGIPDWDYIPAIKKLVDTSEIVNRNTCVAVINPNFDQLLKRDDMGRVVICGDMTDRLLLWKYD
ncbi:hypothetical protein BJ170DRAFT_590574 [Xylariales sp. AK1849]|nr:hypothetical protein BJ170DRAFT_590574 [Xylariales sp. AK1849]